MMKLLISSKVTAGVKAVGISRNVTYLYTVGKTLRKKILGKAASKRKANIAENPSKQPGQDENSIEIILPSTTAPSLVNEFM